MIIDNPGCMHNGMILDKSGGLIILQGPWNRQERAWKRQAYAVDRAISTRVVALAEKFLCSNNTDPTRGMWYCQSYAKALKARRSSVHFEYMTGHASCLYWEKTGDFEFRVKEGQSPSHAIVSFLKGPTICDCGNAAAAVYYAAILHFFGAEIFNKVFGPGSLFPLTIGNGWGDRRTPLPLLCEHPSSGGLARVTPGTAVYFQGVPQYLAKHRGGEGQGLHAICVDLNSKGIPLFMGHGFSRPLTESEISRELIGDYNRPRDEFDRCAEKRYQQDLYRGFSEKVPPEISRAKRNQLF